MQEYTPTSAYIANRFVEIYNQSVLLFEHGKFGRSVPHAHVHPVPLRDEYIEEAMEEVKKEIPSYHEMSMDAFSFGVYPELKNGYVMLQVFYKDGGVKGPLWHDAYSGFGEENKASYMRKKLVVITGQPHLTSWKDIPDSEKPASLRRADSTRTLLRDLL
jgi:hypothetical protein